MAMSVDVNLPRSHEPRFPDRCVVCGRDGPRSHARIVTGTLGWWTWLMWWWGRPFTVKAPTCPGCAWKLQGLRGASLLATMLITALALVLIWPLFNDSVPPGLRRWAMMGLALVCILPQIVLEVLHARPFDVTAFQDSVDYEFTSLAYAVEFAAMNVDAAWVKIEGQDVSDEGRHAVETHATTGPARGDPDRPTLPRG